MRSRPFPVPSTTGRTKWLIKFGSNTHKALTYAELRPYIKAVQYTLRWGRFKKDRDVLDLLREFEQFLKSLPPAPPQANMRGVKAKFRAYAILSHIYAQGLKHRFRPQDAALRILSRAIAAELCPKPTSDPFYKRIQVVRVVRRLLKAQKLVLYGRTKKYRISRQGRHVSEHLYEAVSKQYRWFLTESRKKEILNTRWIKESMDAAAERAVG
jgi:hypothetical protein